MKRLILVGSPRTRGRSGALAEALFEENIAEFPQDELFLVPISEVDVGPCIGCNRCREKTEVLVKDSDGKEVRLWKHRCIFDDDVQAVYDLLDDADEVVVVCPVYFSGAPAPFKCLLDRLQPYYWEHQEAREVAGDACALAGSASDAQASSKNEARQANEGSGNGATDITAKRPATLHVIGEGGDPHGFDALVSEVRSSLAVAGFRLERLLDWVGCIDASGQITAEAREQPLVALSASGLVEATAAHEDAATVERPRLRLDNGGSRPNGPGTKTHAKGGSPSGKNLGQRKRAHAKKPTSSDGSAAKRKGKGKRRG